MPASIKALDDDENDDFQNLPKIIEQTLHFGNTVTEGVKNHCKTNNSNNDGWKKAGAKLHKKLNYNLKYKKRKIKISQCSLSRTC